MKKRTIIIVALIAVAIIGYLIFQGFQKSKELLNQWQTSPLERGELTAIVGATGSVRSRQSAVLSWQTSGKVAMVHAQIDQYVSDGYVMAELEKASLPQNVILAEADLVNARRALENLKISESTRAKANQAMVLAQKALDDAMEKRESKDYARSSNETLDQARANFILADEALKQAEDIYSYVADLPENDTRRAQGLLALSTARKKRDTALANLNYLLSSPDPQEISEADALVEVAKANLEDAEREWERIKEGTDPDDLAAAEARVKALEATINLFKVESPIFGTVTVSNLKPGDQVTPGMVAFRVDDLSSLYVDMLIPEVDINRIELGDPARITFDAIQGKEYLGKVVEVGRVGTGGGGVVNFSVTVELTDQDNAVKPGMTAAVNIIVNQLNDVLLIPNRAVRFIEGKQYVFVLKENKPTQIEVEIGATSETVSELIKGELKEGDPIVLNPIIQVQPGPPSGFSD